MSQSKELIACTFCDATGISIGVITAHFRRYLPELLPYTEYDRVRTDPYHPLPILREYLRSAGRKPWTDRLHPGPADATTHQVVHEFGRWAATTPGSKGADWGDRDFEAVSQKHWDDMLADVIAAHAVARSTPKLRAHVERVVMAAIESSFAQKRKDEEAENARAPSVVISDDERGIEMHRDDDADDDDDDDEPVRAHRVHRRGRGRGGAVVVENNASASNRGRRDAVSRDITGGRVRVDQGNKNVLTLTDRARHAPTTLGSAPSAAEFDRFPLLDLVVHILGVVIRIPVQYNATLADVLGAIERHARNPIRGLGVKGVVSGRDTWMGVWTERVWEQVVEEARDLDDAAGVKATGTVTYYVDFAVAQKM